jgi:dTDP-glucose 4,6-dehydratase
MTRKLLKLNYNVNVIDKCSYAANKNLLKEFYLYDNFSFVEADIIDFKIVDKMFKDLEIDTVIHFAAESHVDNSIKNPDPFLYSNIIGTYSLLEVCRENWKDLSNKLFYHVSTDEVYGTLKDNEFFNEESNYDPSSPYSSTKTCSDMLVKAWSKTYKIPYIISNCSNNYGPYQASEKFIPTILNSIKNKKTIPLYGNGMNYRDWLYVEDHCDAIYKLICSEYRNQVFLIGGNACISNIELIELISELINQKPNIEYVKDREAHDYRYAIDYSKINKLLNWNPNTEIIKGLEKTIKFYLNE